MKKIKERINWFRIKALWIICLSIGIYTYLAHGIIDWTSIIIPTTFTGFAIIMCSSDTLYKASMEPKKN